MIIKIKLNDGSFIVEPIIIFVGETGKTTPYLVSNASASANHRGLAKERSHNRYRCFFRLATKTT